MLITPLGGFTTRMKVAGWGGFILALPVVLWQVWRFIVPGLESKEKRYARPFILCTVAAVPPRRLPRLPDAAPRRSSG